MKTYTAKKIAFLFPSILLILFVSWIIGSTDFFATAVLALIVGVFCWDIEEYCDLFRKKNHSHNFAPIVDNLDVKQRKITAYVLNLDRAKERRNFILSQVNELGIPYERIAAVDGKAISEEERDNIVHNESYKNFFKMLPESGTIGCSLSHEKAWRCFLESDNEFALVFEDDVKFEPQKLAEVVESAIDHKDIWDILSFESNHYGYPQKVAKLAQDESIVFYMTNVKHAGAYLINRNAAKQLLEKFYPIKMPLDHYYTRSWEFGLRFCGVEPRIVEQKFGDTMIKNESTERFEDAKTLAVNILHNIYTEFMRTVYNFLLYISSRRKL